MIKILQGSSMYTFAHIVPYYIVDFLVWKSNTPASVLAKNQIYANNKLINEMFQKDSSTFDNDVNFCLT